MVCYIGGHIDKPQHLFKHISFFCFGWVYSPEHHKLVFYYKWMLSTPPHLLLLILFYLYAVTVSYTHILSGSVGGWGCCIYVFYVKYSFSTPYTDCVLVYILLAAMLQWPEEENLQPGGICQVVQQTVLPGGHGDLHGEKQKFWHVII